MYRTVDTATWGDPWFEELPPPAKLLFLYLITNSRTAMCGAYPITIRTMHNETCLPEEQIVRILAAFGDRVVWMPDERYIFVRNFYRHQRAKSSEKYRVGAAKEVGLLPISVRERVLIAYPELGAVSVPNSHPTDTLPIPYQYPSDRASTDTDTDTEAKTETNTPLTPRKREGRRGTRIPDDFTLTDEMVEYAAEKGVTRAEAAAMTEEFVLYWQTTTKNPTCLDWVKRWQGRLLEEIGRGKIGPSRTRASPSTKNGHRPVDSASGAERFGTRTARISTLYGEHEA